MLKLLLNIILNRLYFDHPGAIGLLLFLLDISTDMWKWKQIYTKKEKKNN